MSVALYPPSPVNLPAGITEPNLRYRFLIAATMGSIFLFMVLYLALLAGALGLVYLTLMIRFESYGLWTILFHLGSVLAACMVVVFLVKFLFKAGRKESEKRLQLLPEKHPELFAFVHQLCQESGAPMPKHIFISGEVNASVSYDSTLLSLFWPTKKNLLIGLGLVNGLTLSEFKAVLAHEFGHFAQRSMKLGSYTHTASRIIHDMVFERDSWDDTLAKWRGLDLRVSAVAWLMTGLIWLVRKVLELAYQGIHLVHASLSREMEFEADRMAVRMAGSEAICQALYQLIPTSNAFQQALGQLGTALEHKIATDDIFYHQSLYLTEQLAERAASVTVTPTTAPGRRFAPDEVQVVAMYASHPDDYLREERALALNVPGPTDDRSPWLLFNEAAELRQAITRMLYPEYAPQEAPTWLPAAEVEDFLRAERKELEYHAQYAGSYDNRTLTHLDPATFEEVAATTTLPGNSLVEAAGELFGPELQKRADDDTTRRADLQKLSLFQRKLTKDRHFTVAGTTYAAAEAATVVTQLKTEHTQYEEWLREFDRQSIALHWQLTAGRPELRTDWLARYHMQYQVQYAWAVTRKADSGMSESIANIQQQGQISEKEAYQRLFDQRRNAFVEAMNHIRTEPMLPLTHLQEYDTLYSFVMQDCPEPRVAQLNGEWINEFMHTLSLTDERLRRLYFKNLGVLLRLQEQIVASYQPTEVATPSAV